MIANDLTPEELRDLIAMIPRGTVRWHWLNVGGFNGTRVDDVAISHDGTAIQAAEWRQQREPAPWRDEIPATAAGVVRAAYGALLRERDHRRQAAAKAAATRARRRELRIAEQVEHLHRGGAFRAATRCAICGKEITDSQSRARGIGSECWQGVMVALERHRREETELAECEAAGTSEALRRWAADPEPPAAA